MQKYASGVSRSIAGTGDGKGCSPLWMSLTRGPRHGCRVEILRTFC